MSQSTIKPQVNHDVAFRHEVLEGFLSDLHDVSTTKDKQELLTSIQSFAFQFLKDASNKELTRHGQVDQGLEVLWRMFIEMAKVLEKDDPFHDKLVLLLLWTKEFDQLHKDLHPSDSVKAFWESYGFGNSLQKSWEQTLSSGTSSQLCNLAAFSTKALSAGVCQDTLALTALWYLREALEKGEEGVTANLLPAAVMWVDQCRHRLLTFSILDRSYEAHPRSDLSACGALTRAKGVNRSGGFSIERWLFWRERFQHLSHSQDSSVAKEAKRGFMTMINCGRDLGYEVPGEARFAERLQKAMWEALVESGKESLDGDEIDIKVDWADEIV
ncbi:uncharacterized protein NECHADRAFT_87592 [Fusarium vanettenii 77-13-4]|uniref:Uncharacterized protein n=1 Tax=Fusarium vanettenii (strain ATCC MYA-4622 / CBS 123669 / FGSC 9596 / NRRL 45880 / 77-13-4) TaxID=660122 RepID=C7Z2G3_FUSV7|nr:uncharacterized protein NECHADRAFT_87592 [Fusarium vanettenii 77-13-4]EEU41656.1 hypothetical protein NECHADRAFT_87592 [Fusarium vanettenii 77-13-4]